MASPVPAKLQPLHNFSMPHLKWKNNRSGRNRLAGEASASSPPHRSPSSPWRESPPRTSNAHAPSPPRRQSSPSHVSQRPSPLHKQSPMRDSESEPDPNNIGSQSLERSDKRMIYGSSTKSAENNSRKRSNMISIRLRKNSNNIKQEVTVVEQNHSLTPADDSLPAAAEDESLPKTWNLRPRRPPVSQKQSTGGLPKIVTSGVQENKTSHQTIINKQSSELNSTNNIDLEKSKKQKFSIALARDEIEEDIFLLTGSKPSRRPKKRPKTIQKQLDNLFPGMWLDSITADSYKVSEAPSKG